MQGEVRSSDGEARDGRSGELSRIVSRSVAWGRIADVALRPIMFRGVGGVRAVIYMVGKR